MDRSEPITPRRWHHRPNHLFELGRTYMVTASTLHSQRLFDTPARLSFLEAALLSETKTHGWNVEAWAVFPNHYHVVASSPQDGRTLRNWVRAVHSQTARELNAMDGMPGRQVWFQFWDNCISFVASYYARLNYVLNNPVKHGYAERAEEYPYGCARWFGQNADAVFVKRVRSYGWERVRVYDPF